MTRIFINGLRPGNGVVGPGRHGTRVRIREEDAKAARKITLLDAVSDQRGIVDREIDSFDGTKKIKVIITDQPFNGLRFSDEMDSNGYFHSAKFEKDFFANDENIKKSAPEHFNWDSDASFARAQRQLIKEIRRGSGTGTTVHVPHASFGLTGFAPTVEAGAAPRPRTIDEVEDFDSLECISSIGADEPGDLGSVVAPASAKVGTTTSIDVFVAEGKVSDSNDPPDRSGSQLKGKTVETAEELQEVIRKRFSQEPATAISQAKNARQIAVHLQSVVSDLRINNPEIPVLLERQVVVLDEVIAKLGSGGDQEATRTTVLELLRDLIMKYLTLAQEDTPAKSVLAVAALGVLSLSGVSVGTIEAVLIGGPIVGLDMKAIKKFLKGMVSDKN